jgi:hypothetical protein
MGISIEFSKNHPWIPKLAIEVQTRIVYNTYKYVLRCLQGVNGSNGQTHREVRTQS